jgi:hypothetical protein
MLRVSRFSKDIKLQVHGQGVFTFEVAGDFCVFYLYNVYENDGLRVEFTRDSILVSEIQTQIRLVDKNNKEGLSKNDGAYYWFSLDSQNQTLYAGLGEARLENAAYKFQYKVTNLTKAFLENITHIAIPKEITSLIGLTLLRDPITLTVPLFVKDIDHLTMSDIAKGNIMPSANLSDISLKLYNCISGKRFVLDDKDFPDFSNAIEYSIATKGLWCNTRLKEKSTEFSKDKPNILETYLRITLGQNNGESPGIPYVMEIWPPGHYSPIHSHAGADAVIRVLHGEIHVDMYPYLSMSKVKPFAQAEFKKDDITWISPNLNQVHKLTNTNKDMKTCVTIQTYMYNGKNNTHYDYFDYIDADGKKQQYQPDSDMDFLQFKALMKKEWDARPMSCISFFF